MKETNLIILTAIFSIILNGDVFAAGEAGGLTFLSEDSVSASLGGAVTARTNDINVMAHNPASLGTLESGHASFSYEQGLAEDSYGQVQIGNPGKNGAWGASVGYYDGGDLELSNGESISAQKDFFISGAYSFKLKSMSLGLAGKYLSSELAETAKASAYAADFGLTMPITNRLQFGAALLNLGTQLKYANEGDDLPRIASAGLAYGFNVGSFSNKLFVDVPYHMVEQEVEPGIGLELGYGPLALRAGYKQGSQNREFSIGSGFALGRTSLDYSFAMLQDFDGQHRVSLSMRFGTDKSATTTELVRNRVIEAAPKAEPVLGKRVVKEESEFLVLQRKEAQQSGRRTLADLEKANSKIMKKNIKHYIVRDGDSLASIAKQYYGLGSQWKVIYRANQHLIDNPKEIEVGQKIILP